MCNGIRRVSVERGYDPRDFALVGAGGAAGAHITALAREMGIEDVFLPKLASGLCAFGQIISDVKYNYMATAPFRLEGDETYSHINRLFKEIEAKGADHLKGDGFTDETIDTRRSLDMRYVGQVHECTVEIATFEIDAGTIDRVKDAFHRRHEQLYTYAEPDSAIEVVNIESTLYGRVPKPNPPRIPEGGDPQAAIKDQRDMIFSADGTSVSAPVYDGGKIGAGDRIDGPAVIEEVTTTIVIEPGWAAALDQSGSYRLQRTK